jgi:molybdopterin converting factor small subunit
MTIMVKLFATLREGRFDSALRQYTSRTTVADVMRDLALSDRDVALTLVNGRHADLDHALNDGDTLALFPPIGGGQCG